MEQSTGFCTIELRRGHLTPFWQVMDGIDIGARFPPKSRRGGRNFGRTSIWHQRQSSKRGSLSNRRIGEVNTVGISMNVQKGVHNCNFVSAQQFVTEDTGIFLSGGYLKRRERRVFSRIGTTITRDFGGGGGLERSKSVKRNWKQFQASGEGLEESSGSQCPSCISLRTC